MDIDQLQQDGAQESRLRKFTPNMVDHRYLVTLWENRWDPDEGKFTDTITAIGPIGARRTAEDKWRPQYPECVAVHVEEIVLGPEFCERCGFAYSVHDNTDVLNATPFGCPTEMSARERWGR